MKFVIQIASNASVEIEHKIEGHIDYGYVVLIGIEEADTKEIADKIIKKMLGLRIFPDENGKTNLNLNQVNGDLLCISQFTLYADCKKGNRPSFMNAGSPQHANEIYEYIIEECRRQNYHVETGIFGAEMHVTFTNEGPFTIILDSKEL